MAYLIFNGNNLYKIATSDDKAHLNIEDSFYNVKTVSDSDFNNVKQNKKSVKLSSDTVVYEDLSFNFTAQENLQSYINEVITHLEYFLQNNSSNSMYSVLETYRDLLQSVDISSISYPLSKSWEEYCVENSITYYNPLQIP